MTDQDRTVKDTQPGQQQHNQHDQNAPTPLADRRWIEEEHETNAPDFIYRDWASI